MVARIRRVLHLLFILALGAAIPVGGMARAAPLSQQPPAPTDLVAVAVSRTQVDLTWVDHATTELYYQVDRSTDGGDTYSRIGQLAADITAFSDSGRAPCTQYTYRVRAVENVYQSAWSAPASATTPEDGSLSTVTVVQESFEGGAIPVGWENPGAWAIRITSPSPVGGANAQASSAGGALRTPVFDCSDASELSVDYYKRSSVTGSETSYYRVYLEGAGLPVLLAEYTTADPEWIHEAMTVPRSAAFSSSCRLAFDARRTSSQSAFLDGVTITKRISDPVAPTEIIQHPTDVSVCEGATATLSVEATGDALSYQWQARPEGATPWQEVGANSPTYEMPSVTVAQNGLSVRCLVTGRCGVAYSYPASLQVAASGVAITSQPLPQTVCAGEGASFAVGISGTAQSFHWERDTGSGFVALDNGGAVSGADSATLVLSEATPDDVGMYRCVVTGSCGTAVSEAAALAIGAAPAITLPPADQTLLEGASAAFSVSAEGTFLTYQWETSTDAGVAFTAIPGATSAAYSSPPLGIADDGRQYRCVVTGSCGAAASTAATITVLRAQQIPLQTGWNAISLNVSPPDTAIGALLNGIIGDYSAVYSWQQDAWHIYDPAAPASSALQNLELGSGYWVLATAPVTLQVAGRVLMETAVPLAEGWSLVGFPSDGAMSVPEAFAPDGPCPGVSLVYSYAAGPQPTWSHYDLAADAWASTMTELIPGQAYWVRTSQACAWRVAY